MKFRFSKFSIFVITSLFLTIALFGFIMSLEGDDFYGDSFDAEDTEPDNILQIHKTEKELLEVPEASVSSDFLGSFTLWYEWTLDVPWIDIDFDYTMIFPDIYSGYTAITNELSSAPLPIQMVLYLIPITLVFIVLRSLEVGI